MKLAVALFALGIAAVPDPRPVLSQAQPPRADDWFRATEDDERIKIETDKLEAAIPKKNPKQWMTGIEKGSFLD